MPLASVLSLLVIGVSLLLMLWRPWNLPEAWWVCGGAALLLMLQLITLHAAAQAVAQGTDVYLFLIGMMLLSALAREQGIFDWAAAHAVRGARGRRSRLFALVYAMGTLVTVCLSNDATAVVLTPAVLTAVKRARVKPLPYVFACAMVANAASFALPISNPANLVVFGREMPGLGHWLVMFLLPCLCSTVATFAVLRGFFREELRGTFDVGDDESSADGDRRGALPSGGRLVVAGLVFVIAVLLAANGLGLQLGWPTLTAALLVVGVVAWRTHENPLRLLRTISVSTLLLVAGLFVFVRAAEGAGALGTLAQGLHSIAHLPVALGAPLLALVVGLSNNLLNNLPVGLIAGETLRATHTQGWMREAVLVAVDVGPNLAVTGSLATVLWLLALRRAKVQVSAWQFLRVGLIAMPAALLASIGAMLLQH